MMHRFDIVEEKGKWFWYARDVMGRICGKSWKGFSKRSVCEHNASVVQAGLTQGLRSLGYNR